MGRALAGYRVHSSGPHIYAHMPARAQAPPVSCQARPRRPARAHMQLVIACIQASNAQREPPPARADAPRARRQINWRRLPRQGQLDDEQYVAHMRRRRCGGGVRWAALCHSHYSRGASVPTVRGRPEGEGEGGRAPPAQSHGTTPTSTPNPDPQPQGHDDALSSRGSAAQPCIQASAAPHRALRGGAPSSGPEPRKPAAALTHPHKATHTRPAPRHKKKHPKAGGPSPGCCARSATPVRRW